MSVNSLTSLVVFAGMSFPNLPRRNVKLRCRGTEDRIIYAESNKYALRLAISLYIYGERDKTRHEEPQCFPLDRNSLSQDLNEIRKNVKVKGLAV